MAGGPAPSHSAHGAAGPDVPGWQYPVALSAGILLWMLHLAGGMGLVGISCQIGSVWPIHLLTVVTAVPTVLAGALGWHVLRTARSARRAHGALLLGWLAIVFNAASLVLILAEAIPLFLLDACA